MSIKTIEDILPLVEKPSRYLGGEINQIKKDPDSVKLRFALAFPDLYEIGTSHFGMQILYHIRARCRHGGPPAFRGTAAVYSGIPPAP
jgi:hypothetical protein